MSEDKGIFITLEGTDGSGKGTQFRLLKERLSAVGYDVEVFDFPQYEHESSYFVKQYLNGIYGPAKTINPYTASLFYALDRYESAPQIRKALEQGKVVLANRYVGSNMAHQGSKFSDAVEQRSFFVWEDSLEYQLLNIPRPKINVVLRMPAEIAQGLVGQKAERNYTKAAHDEHEADLDHLKKTAATYELLCQLFPNDFKPVECTQNNQLLSIPEINNQIWDIVKPLLPTQPSKTPRPVTFKLYESAEAAPAKTKKFADTNPVVHYQGKLSLAAIYEARLAGLEVKIPKLSWAKTEYNYYMPAGLAKKTAAKYEEFMEHFADQVRSLKDKLKDEAVLASAMPLAALFNVEISSNVEELKSAIDKLAASQLEEIAALATALNKQGRRVRPSMFGKESTAAGRKGPEPINKIIARLAADLPQNLAAQTEPVELMEAWPRNEFRILVDTVYPYSNLPKSEIQGEIDRWNYQQKTEALQAALQTSDVDTLNKFHYQFDITSERPLLWQVLQSNLGHIKVQAATPRYGYDVPELVDTVGVADPYLDCFDKSLELFSTLQAAGREDLAVYATLLGHKNRFQVDASLGKIKNCLAAASGDLAKLLEEMVTKIGEHHPIVGEELAKIKAPQIKPAEPTPKPAAKKRRRGSRRSGKKAK